MATQFTNDVMYERLKEMYPSLGSLGDMLYQYWVDNGLQYRGSLQYEYYATELGKSSEGLPVPQSWGDRANLFWGDQDFVVYNLEDETGSDLLLEDGELILLEAGNG